MSQKASPKIIGAFIIAAVALGVAGLMLFGSTRFLTEAHTFVLYFDASLKGLNPGAPVKFRGVTIGSVADVRIRFNQAPHDLSVPVLIEIREDWVREKSDDTLDLSQEATINSMVVNGLRAKLEAQSLVTGLLYVELGYENDTRPPRYHQLKPIHPEIPTVPADIEELLANLASVDIKGLTARMDTLISNLNVAVGTLPMRDIGSGLTNLLTSLNRIASSPGLTNTLAHLDATLIELREASAALRQQLSPLSQDVAQTLGEARRSLAELREGMTDLREILAPDAPLRLELGRSLEQLGTAAGSLAELANYLNRHPNALISGRESAPRKP